MTEAHRSKQLAQGYCAALPDWESNLRPINIPISAKSSRFLCMRHNIRNLRINRSQKFALIENVKRLHQQRSTVGASLLAGAPNTSVVGYIISVNASVNLCIYIREFVCLYVC